MRKQATSSRRGRYDEAYWTTQADIAEADAREVIAEREKRMQAS